ncbi:MAG: hypothetical protein J1F31_03685 [Erysipelotrichales bacterium]|nr:hypothetical protein [Erysipelotrichales bacterium]
MLKRKILSTFGFFITLSTALCLSSCGLNANDYQKRLEKKDYEVKIKYFDKDSDSEYEWKLDAVKIHTHGVENVTIIQYYDQKDAVDYEKVYRELIGDKEGFWRVEARVFYGTKQGVKDARFV